MERNPETWVITDSAAGADHLTITGSSGQSLVVHHNELADTIHELNNPQGETK